MSKIAAIIVTYYPDLASVSGIVSVLDSNNIASIIVDNSEKEIDFSNLRADITWLERNRGIAYAQNVGIKKAIKSGYEYFIFFDQDSHIDSKFIHELIKYRRNDEPYIAAPIFCDKKTGYSYPLIDIDSNGRRKKIPVNCINERDKVRNVISSGMLINRKAYLKVGDMNEDLFIDYVDTEWCLRAASYGLGIEIITSAVMIHEIGNSNMMFLGYPIPIHSYQRRYYRIRNALLMLRMKHIPKRLAIREILFSFLHQCLLVIKKKNKWKYIKVYMIAFRDGVKGKTGVLSKKV